MSRTPLAFAFALLLLALPGRAQTPAPANIGLQVQVIQADTTKAEPDPRLKAIQKRLEAFPTFQSFKLLAEQDFLLGLQTQGRMSLPGGRTLEVRPQKFEDAGKLLLALHLKGKSDVPLVNADAAIDPGGAFFVAMRTKDQGTMIVHIRHSRTSTP